MGGSEFGAYVEAVLKILTYLVDLKGGEIL